MKRVAIYVDISNLYYSLKHKYGGRKLDYKKFLAYVEGDLGNIVLKRAYGASKEGYAVGFKTMLSRLGFQTIYKIPVARMHKGELTHKADHDVTIAIDMVRYLDSADRIILASADGDMLPAIKYAVARGKDVIVLASGISNELREYTTACIEIPESLLLGK